MAYLEKPTKTPASYDDLLAALAGLRSMLLNADIERETRLAALRECSDMEIKLAAAMTPKEEKKTSRY